jgi:hypothetical protein
MTDAQEKAALDFVLDAIDVPRALVILVDEHGGIESGDKGLGPQNTMLVCFSLAHAIAQQLKAEAPQQPQLARPPQRPLIYLPPDLQRKLDAL